MTQNESEAVDRIIQTTPLPKRAFTEAEAAFYLSVSRSFLRQSRMNGVREKRTAGPPYIKMARMIRYLREDLDAWLEQFRKGEPEDDS